jgi:signal transduction histidine kinase/signal transduction protein with GAF and PtsI domain
MFVTVVSVTYSLLSYHVLDVEGTFTTLYERFSMLLPIVVMFYLIAVGTSFYKKVKHQAAELGGEKEYTRNLLKSSFDAIIAVNSIGYITEVNERTCELFECDRKEMEKHPVMNFYAPGEARRVINALRKSEEGSIENFSTYILSKSDEEIPILLSASFLYDRNLNLKKELAGGKQFPTVGYFRDKRAEDAVDNIAKKITSKTAEKAVFDKIAEIVAKTLKAEACSLLTYNERKGAFKVIASYGMPETLKRSEWLEEYDEKDSSMIAKTFALRQTLNISNIDVNKQQPRDIKIKWQYVQNFSKYSRFGDFKHFLGTPLIVQDEVYGIIRVINKYCSDGKLDKKGFTEKDIIMLERISSQVSILVEKVRDKGRFKAISKVGRELNEMVDVPLEKLLEIIAEEVVKGMRFKACYLRLIEGGDNLKIKACYGLKGDYKENDKYIIKIGEGIAGKVVQTGGYRTVMDLREEKEFAFKGIWQKEGLRSMLSIPLKYRSRVIGVINCYTHRIHKFTEQEIQIMNTFAANASIAIQNKKRVDELVALNEIGNELVKPVKINELFDVILRKAKAISGADCLCVKNYDERSWVLMKTVCALNCKWHEQNKDYKVNIREGVGADILGEVINSGKSRIISNYEKIREKLTNVPERELFKNVKSCVLIPIKIDNKVYGVLFLESYILNFFTEDDLLVLQAFSSQAAIALKNANFFNKLQKVTETFPKISELNIDIDTVLDNIADIASEVLETDVLVLYQYDEKNKKIIWPPIFKGDIIYPEYMISPVDETDAPMLFINRGKNHYAESSQDDPIMAPGQNPRKGIPKRFLFREKIASSAAILLKVGQETVGIMFINYRIPHKFNEDERRIIENYASYIAIAIQNVKHFYEKEVAAAMQTLGHLAPAIAHKIRNDIGTISLYTGHLIDETEKDSPQSFPLNQIKGKIHKITRDIDFLMDASKLKIPEKKFIDLKNFIDEIESEILSDLKARKISLEIRIADNLPKIKIDPAQIKMVLINLAYNSIDAMPNGGKIFISISKFKKVVLLEWKDTGTGISPEYAAKVFELFWTTKDRGFGLGLFLSKTIIEEHEGSISLDSKYKKGAKFTIKFPIKCDIDDYQEDNDAHLLFSNGY